MLLAAAQRWSSSGLTLTLIGSASSPCPALGKGTTTLATLSLTAPASKPPLWFLLLLVLLVVWLSRRGDAGGCASLLLMLLLPECECGIRPSCALALERSGCLRGLLNPVLEEDEEGICARKGFVGLLLLPALLGLLLLPLLLFCVACDCGFFLVGLAAAAALLLLLVLLLLPVLLRTSDELAEAKEVPLEAVLIVLSRPAAPAALLVVGGAGGPMLDAALALALAACDPLELRVGMVGGGLEYGWR